MIQSVWIEIRPSLRCCHVCAVLEKDIDSKVQVKVKKSSLLIKENSVTYEIPFPDFMVEPMTMANFKCTNRFLNFRVQVNCEFKHQSPSPLNVNPPVFGEKMSSLHCQCHNPLTSKIKFDRILPLPSKDINPSDLFCHAHDGAASLSLNPKPNDCLYSDDFIVLNDEILIGCFKKNKLLKCKRCTTTVGIFCDSSIKIWKSDIYLPFDNFTPLKHFKYLIQKVVDDPFSIFPKILLECEENHSSLSIVIVDKNLVISTCEQDLQLKNSEVVKLKYKFNSMNDPQVKLNSNTFFNSVNHSQVSKTMLDFIVQYLTSASKKIPFIFSRENDDCMAYLNLSE